MSTSPELTRAAPFAALAYPALGVAAVDADAAQRGFAAGLARGRARAEQELADRSAALELAAAERRTEEERRLASARQQLERAAAALDARVAPVLADAERTLAEAALELAAAVVGAELARDPGSVARTVLDAVLRHPDAADLIAVRMHPLAIDALRDAAPAASAAAPAPTAPAAAPAPTAPLLHDRASTAGADPQTWRIAAAPTAHATPAAPAPTAPAPAAPAPTAPTTAPAATAPAPTAPLLHDRASTAGADAQEWRIAGVRLVADASLAVGDAVGELPDGLVDATIAGALARAKRALLGEDA